jgi:SAM-dependent methyltransferase
MSGSGELKLRRMVPTWVLRASPYGMYRTLRTALEGCGTVLDLGCGPGSLLEHFADSCTLTGMDRYLPALEENRRRGRYHARVLGDLHSLPFGDKSADAVVALDVIEHLDREGGFDLLRDMERTARRRVVVLTPNGFVPQRADANSWQLHRSGWSVGDFRQRGYDVYGVYGMKGLRGEYSRLKFRPWLLWEAVSALSYPFTYGVPSWAFGLCAVKRLDR